MGSSEKAVNNLQYQLFIVSISLLGAVNGIILVLFGDSIAAGVLRLVDAMLTPFFLVDFALRMAAAPSKSRYFFKQFGWADLLGSLWIPGLDFLRVFRIFRVVAILKNIPKVSGGQPWRVVRRERANSILGSMVVLAILVLEVGGVAVLYFESASASANITTPGDALWWGIVTIATVGYGDKYTVTPGGRVVGTTAIIVGVALFSTISAFLANGFTITVRPDVMAACDLGSMDQQFLNLLNDVAAGGPDGAVGLMQQTAGGARQMRFSNGGPATE